MAFNPNDEQKSAINANGSIVVYAAAGSGKTAVLTQRVKKLICDEQNPVSADRILVVTFTNAAAAEMRARIIEAVNKEVEERKVGGNLSDNLLRQQMILSAANICTIDSFCANLIRENFETVGINPDFKLSDEIKNFEISRKVIKEMVAQRVVSEDKNFKLIGDAIGIDTSLANFSKVISSIYNKSRSLPNPKKWLLDIKNSYGESGNIEEWLGSAFHIADQMFTSLETLIDTYLYEAQTIEEGAKCAETINAELTSFRTAFRVALYNKDWDKAKAILENTSVSTISSGVKKVDAWLYDHLRGLREEALDSIKKLLKIFEYDLKENTRLMSIEAKAVATLVDFVIEYGERFSAEMLSQNLMTFDMVTHAAFSAVCKYENGIATATEFGKILAKCFDEVLVDEYQDNNSLQDAFFNVISNNGKNLFMVGDAKQSIYGFRNANPENFIYYRDNSPMYPNQQGDERAKVVLYKNYRSRAEICEFVNYLFGAIMRKEPSGMDYTNDDIMNSGATYPDADEKAVEIHIVNRERYDDSRSASASHIAEYIKTTMKRPPFLSDKNGGLRRAKYSDFAILMRSLKEKATVYANTLKEAGIPVSFNTGGLFDTAEIMALHSLLKAIDNPKDDVAILATLTGPVFALGMERIAEIKANNKADNFYGSLILAASKGDKDVVDAFNKLKYLRRLSATSSVSEFVSNLVDEFNLREIMSSYSEGARRRANIDAFITIAEEFEADSHSGLSSFLRMLESFIESDRGVETSQSTDDAVKIVSIHGSKGLEYPICILAETSSRFNDKDSFDTVRMDEKFGISVNIADLVSHKKYEPISAKVIRRGMHNRLIAEEQRLLYVALTRAKEKLVMVIDGATHNPNKLESMAKSISHREKLDFKLSNENILSSNCYAGWIIMAAQMHKDGAKLGNVANGSNSTFSVEYFSDDASAEVVSEKPVVLPNPELVKAFSERFNYSYPYMSAVNTPTKTSVSKLLAQESDNEYAFTRRPAIFSENKMNAAEKGTATHKFMQYASFDKAKKDLESEITRLAEWEYLSEQEIEVLDRAAIEKFLGSDLCKEILASSMVLKEQRFLVPLNDGENDTVIQGAVDCVYANDDGLSIIDFKTTRFETDEQFVEAYSRQLDIYAEAMEQILDMKVTSKYIYSLHLSKTIKL